MKILLGTLAVGGVVALFMWAIPVGLEKQAIMDCYKWEVWEKEYRLFEASDDMVKDCKALGVEIVVKEGWEFDY